MAANNSPMPPHGLTSGTANDPPIDPRKPPPNLEPGSHSTGGAKDHQLPHEGEGAASR